MAANDKVKKSEEGGLKRYLRGVKAEFKKVVWPTKKEVLNYTIIVIVACIIVSLILGIYDRILIFLVNLFIGR